MRISVVIPTFNAGPGWTALLERLRSQKPVAPDEIIVVDSGSTDATVNLARNVGAKVVEWQQPFDHGLTRDAGIAAATGDVICLTVQDALPASEDWLETMTRHFKEGAGTETVAGVTGRQIPPPDGPLELRIKAALDAQQGAGPVHVSLASHPNYSGYTPAQRMELYRFDNVCSVIRKSVWQKIPFGACRYAEDYQWARRVLEAGFAIVRDPSASTIHAHSRPFGYELRRALLDAWVLHETFGYRYSIADKLNRVTELSRRSGEAQPIGLSERCRAAKTYAAHVLGRGIYSGYCWLGRPMGMGRSLLTRITTGI